MTTRTVKLDCIDDINKLEALFYRVQTYKDIIITAAESNKQLPIYDEKLIEANIELDNFKREFETKHLLDLESDNSVSWELDFPNKSVVFMEK